LRSYLTEQIYGYDFDRKTPMDNYIVDFCCKQLKLVIELDGRSHDFKISYDVRRQKRLESYGVQVIRFEEIQVLEDIDAVLSEIRYWVKQREKQVYDSNSE
jgi:very-short-patch-repair endonuclease